MEFFLPFQLDTLSRMSLKQIILLVAVCQVALTLPSVRVKRQEEEVGTGGAEPNPIDNEVICLYTLYYLVSVLLASLSLCLPFESESGLEAYIYIL